MNPGLAALVLFVLFGAIACNSTLEEPDNIAAAEILQVKTGKDRLLYAAQDTTTITARIPKDAGALDIKFTTTHGIFVATGSRTVNQYADSLSGNYRYAVVLLTSDSTHTTVYITAEAGSARERTTLNFIN